MFIFVSVYQVGQRCQWIDRTVRRYHQCRLLIFWWRPTTVIRMLEESAKAWWHSYYCCSFKIWNLWGNSPTLFLWLSKWMKTVFLFVGLCGSDHQESSICCFCSDSGLFSQSHGSSGEARKRFQIHSQLALSQSFEVRKKQALIDLIFSVLLLIPTNSTSFMLYTTRLQIQWFLGRNHDTFEKFEKCDIILISCAYTITIHTAWKLPKSLILSVEASHVYLGLFLLPLIDFIQIWISNWDFSKRFCMNFCKNGSIK